MDKNHLRKQMLEKRKELNSDFVKKSEEAVFAKLISSNILNFEKVLVYSSFKNEVPTEKVINFLLSKGIRVFLPKCDTETLTFEPTEVFGTQTRYTLNKYGIAEPIQKESCEKVKIDCAIIPGIVLDKNCNRIGFGAGYYDKFFSKNPDICKIGICYDFQVIDTLPAEAHDVYMDTVITEKNIYFKCESLNR